MASSADAIPLWHSWWTGSGCGTSPRATITCRWRGTVGDARAVGRSGAVHLQQVAYEDLPLLGEIGDVLVRVFRGDAVAREAPTAA